MAFTANVRLRKTVNVLTAMKRVGILRTLMEPRKVLGEIAEDQLTLIRQNIETAGASAGNPWVTMAPMTRLRRPQRRSARHFHSPYEAELLRGFTLRLYGAGTYGEIVTSTRYARLHQEGSGRIPARPLIPDLASRNRARDTALQRIKAGLQAGLKF